MISVFITYLPESFEIRTIETASGGRGRVSPAFIGVAVFEILKTALQFLGVSAYAQFIALGVIIYIAISLDIRKYVAKK